MWRYLLLAAVVLGVAVYYVYASDPCQSQLRAEFAEKYPGYEILGSSAAAGSRESVRCRVSYRKPGSEQTHEEDWLYQDPGTGWQFSSVVSRSQEEETTRIAPEERTGQ